MSCGKSWMPQIDKTLSRNAANPFQLIYPEKNGLIIILDGSLPRTAPLGPGLLLLANCSVASADEKHYTVDARELYCRLMDQDSRTSCWPGTLHD